MITPHNHIPPMHHNTGICTCINVARFEAVYPMVLQAVSVVYVHYWMYCDIEWIKGACGTHRLTHVQRLSAWTSLGKELSQCKEEAS